MKSSHVLAVIALGIIVGLVLTRYFQPDIALFFSFIIIVAGIIFLDRKKVKLTGIVIMRRTTRGRDFIDRTASSNRNLWRIAGNIGVVLGAITMIIITLFLFSQALQIASGAAGGGVKLLLPGPVSDPVNAPGVFVVPWWIWVIGIAVVIIPHEFMHGIMCRIDKVRVKSVGWLLLVLIPGAFVEPDEKQLERQRLGTKLRVYAAGSFANMVTAAVILAVLILFISSSLSMSGIVVSPVENGPAYNSTLNNSLSFVNGQNLLAITEIDGQAINSHPELTAFLDGKRPGDLVTIKTVQIKDVTPHFNSVNILSPSLVGLTENSNTSTHQVRLGENPETGKAYLGVFYGGQGANVNGDVSLFSNIARLLLWMFVFSLGIGMVNMLPIGPLDGGQYLGAIVKNKKITRAISAFVFALLIFNIIGPIFL